MLSLAFALCFVAQGGDGPGGGAPPPHEGQQRLQEWADRLSNAPIGELPTGREVPDKDVLRQLVRACPTKFIAVVGDRGKGVITPPEVTSVLDLLQWLGEEDGSYYWWVDMRGRFVALAPLPRKPTWLPDLLTDWESCSEVPGQALSRLIHALPLDSQALVAHGLPLAPAELPKATRSLLVEVLAWLGGEGGTAWGGGPEGLARAAADPTARVWIRFEPRVSVQERPYRRFPPPDRSATALPLRAPVAEPMVPESPPPVPSGADLQALVAKYEKAVLDRGLGREEKPEEAIGPVREGALRPLPDVSVSVEADEGTVADIAALIPMASQAAAGQLGIRALVEMGKNADPNASVVLTPGQWRADELADALTAAARLSYALGEHTVLLETPPRCVPACLAAQMHLADGWVTNAFDVSTLGWQTPRRVWDLTDPQQVWLGQALGGKEPPPDESRIWVSLEVSVVMCVWGQNQRAAAGADVPKPAGVMAVPGRPGVTEYTVPPVTWFWHRLPGVE